MNPQELERVRRVIDAESARRPARKRKRNDSAETEFPISEDAMALDFVTKYGDTLRWTPGMEWMVDRVNHWSRDDELRRFDLARQIVRAAGVVAGEKNTARIASNKTVAGLLNLARSDPRIVTPMAAWDADPMALNTPSGVVDLRTGTFRERRGLHTRITRVAPAPDMPCPAWERFLLDVFLGDIEMIEFMQRVLGYTLTGDRREQKIFFFQGPGANGKSTLLDIVLWIVGSYGLKLPATALMQTNMERHSTEVAQLQGKRLAISSELDEGQHWAESRIKELTGDEELTARFMRQDNFTFAMTQKHIIAGNYKPRLRGGDAAMARRFVLVPFLAKFEGSKRDAAMLDKLRAEAPAILAWMIRGAMDWADSGLPVPASVAAASADYMRDNDDLAQWLDECCQRDGSARASDLYESFKGWKTARGEHAPSQTTWGPRLEALPGVQKRRSGGIRYEGVRLSISEMDRLHASRR